MKIAIASGKGGTGKSTVAINLSYYLAEKNNDITLLDCDVEEPNCHIFLNPEINYQDTIYLEVPDVDSNKCTGCKKCTDLCEFNALAVVNNKVLIFPELCHGCGGCKLICPQKAIFDAKREVGIIESGSLKNINFIHGKLRIGEAMSPPLIKAVKKIADEKYLNSTQIIDCPPGTSCPVIAAINGVDYVLLVAEPTPFGLNDLALAADMLEEIELPYSIVINKSSTGDYLIEDFASLRKKEIITKIPDNINSAKAYSEGHIIIEKMPEFKKYFEPIKTY